MKEEFEKWWLCTDEDMFQNHTKPEFKAAYLAGAAAMRERCADECEAMVMYPDGREESAKHQDVWVAAAAIRKIEVE